MQDSQQNNKRIAKNTLLLYFRMLLLMVVSLYTSRVTLAALGVEDYGIYNVVGGVVAMFSILSGSLSVAISRFITFELGRSDVQRLKTVFSTSVNIQIGLALIIMMLAETGGVWFLNCKMNIAPERLTSANWVLQCSILTFMVNLISVPYNATIIAHERMSAFAYISILEAVLKLSVVYLLYATLLDRLVVYAILLCFVAIILRLIYGFYCKRHFEECKYHFIYDKSILKSMTGFAEWNFIGSSAGVLRTQGVNILLNLYFGPVVNAARGISVQVNAAVSSFSSNFLMAINPQIIKTYSQGETQHSFQLAMYGARFSFILLSIISMPLICETDFILELWLKEFPNHTVEFVRLSLVLTIVESLSLPLVTLQQATGRLKIYQIVVGGMHMLNFPFSWFLLYRGSQPEVVYFVAIILTILSLYARLYLQKKQLGISVKMFHKEVVLRVLLLGLSLCVIIIIIEKYITNSIGGIFLSIILAIIMSTLIGIKNKEIIYIVNNIKIKLR